MCTPRYDITLDQFMGVAHLLPCQRGNVAVGNCTFVNALLWMCRTGALWRDLPECYGKWITVCRRFNRMKHHRKAATRYDRLDETFLANLQLILIAIYLKKHSQKPN